MQNQRHVSGLHLAADRSSAFIDADYTEHQPDTFRGYVVRIGIGGDDTPSAPFKTIDEAAAYAREQGAQRVYTMSSCDDLEADRERALFHR